MTGRKQVQEMGVRVKVTCRACKSEWDCRTGCGVMHGRLEKVAGLYPDGIQKAIMERAAQMEFPVYDFGYRLARCERCRAVVSIPALSFGSDGVEYAGTCAGCGQEADRMETVEQTQCPVCGEMALEQEETGLWD